MMIDCPVCHNRHSVPDNYDNDIFECNNSGPTPKEFKELTPITLMTRAGYNMNRSSTRVNEERPVTINLNGPDFLGNGEKRTSQKRINW